MTEKKEERSSESTQPVHRGRGKPAADGKKNTARSGREKTFRESRPEKMGGAVAALIDLDQDLMKLLVRRATLVSRIREGRDHASSPSAIQAEKAIREAFEANALSFSKDPKFSRQLFSLLQDLKVLSREEAQNKPGFSLSPPRKPVKGTIPGPGANRTIQLWMALAACSGQDTILDHVPASEPVSACIKAFNQAGGALARQQEGNSPAMLSVVKEAVPSFAGKTLFIGDDALTLYLVSFFACASTGVVRFTGGADMKSADLSALRRFLPVLGARFAHVIPRSQGLPAKLECSGILPDTVKIPAELPLDAVLALLLAPLVWRLPLTVDLSELSTEVAGTALTEMSEIFGKSEADVDAHGSRIVYGERAVKVPSRVTPPLDPLVASYLLAIPAFAGGGLSLQGAWPYHSPGAYDVEGLLGWSGLALEVVEGKVTATALEDRPPVQFPEDLPSALIPLAAALYARNSRQNKKDEPFSCDQASLPIAEAFFARLGLSLENGELVATSGETPHANQAWTSPDAYWGMAYALASFLRPGIRLANPDTVSELLPSFWTTFNSLPEPRDLARQPKTEASSGRAVRRRFKTEE